MRLIAALLIFAAPGCGGPPRPASVSGSQGIDGFLKSLKSDLLDIERRGHKRTSDRFWNKAHDHIEFTACPRENLPAAFQSVRECDREALALLRGFVKERPKEKYTLRKRRRSGGGGGGSSSRPPLPSFTVTRVPQPSPPAPDPPGPAPIAGFCSRSPGIADSIIAALPDPRPACGAVTQSVLNEIITLVVTTTPRPDGSGECRNNHASLRAGDFASLPNMKKIVFGGEAAGGAGCINSVHEDTFLGLSKLEEINWGQQPIASFPADTFRRLPKLKKISLPECHDESVDPSLQNLPQSPMEIVADC